jgi:hypothetical protein
VARFAAGVHCSTRRGKGEHCGTRLARQAVPHFVDGSAQLYRLIGTILIDNYGILGPMMRRRDVPMVTKYRLAPWVLQVSTPFHPGTPRLTIKDPCHYREQCLAYRDQRHRRSEPGSQ